MAKGVQSRGIPTELSLDQFRQFVLPHLTVGSRGPAPKLSLHALFNYILKLLYIGCQWKELPIARDARGLPEIHYTRIYGAFRRWQADGCFDIIFTRVGAGIDRWLSIIRLHSRDACRRSGQLEGSRLSSTMADRTTLMSVKIHALQIQRGPPPQNTEGEVQSDEPAGIRRGSGPAGKPHGLGDR